MTVNPVSTKFSCRVLLQGEALANVTLVLDSQLVLVLRKPNLEQPIFHLYVAGESLCMKIYHENLLEV